MRLPYMPSLAFLWVIVTLFTSTQPAIAASVKTDYVEVEIISAQNALVPGKTAQLALRQSIKSHWHTYWRNPGDSGEATQLHLNLPDGFKMSDFTWPAPQRLPLGPLVNYGYEGDVILPFTLDIPDTVKSGESITLGGDATWLVCNDVCIPEEATLSITLPVSKTASATRHAADIQNVLDTHPKPVDGLQATWQRRGDMVTLSVSHADYTSADRVIGAYFFPYDSAVLKHAAPQPLEVGKNGFSLTLTPGFSLEDASYDQPLAGIIAFGDDENHVVGITANMGGTLPDTAGTPVSNAGDDPTKTTLPIALVFAFFGGLILNLMPCVFPVLSLKAASFAGHADKPRQLRTQGLMFLAGVLVAFLSLASLLAILKATGESLGWGFQLQSPLMVSLLLLVMLAIALNLSGVFEMGTSLQNAGSGTAKKDGKLGAFFTGLLAVVVAAPCTAPFMGTALGFAATQPTIMGLLVFAFLGLGLAAPLVILSFVPQLAKLLPRPGAWMDTFKQLLAFPMYAAAGWLLWVLMRQGGTGAAALGIAIAVTASLALWAYGRRQRTGHGRGMAVIVIASAAAVAFGLYTVSAPQEKLVVEHEPYSAARLAELNSQNKPVFVYFTAAWCVTCLVNERVALSSESVKATLIDQGYTVLKGDWTNHDADITKALEGYGRAGVPLYVVYNTAEPNGKILPQILTPDIVNTELLAEQK